MNDVALDAAPNATDLWQPMQAAVAEFRSECSDLESLIQVLFDDLDRMRVELERKALELENEKQHNDEREELWQKQREDTERFAQHLQLQEERMAGAFAALTDMREQLGTEREQVLSRSKDLDDQAGNRIKQLEEETGELRKQLSESAAEMRLLSRSTLELAQSRAENTQFQQEILRLHDQLHEASGTNVDAKLVSDLEQERNELRDEVELLRDRAAELSQNMVAQKVEMDRQREELTSELKHLRRFVEMQTEMMMTRNPSAATPAARTSDAVTNAVAAQFSKVQRDASERRKGRSAN